MTPKTRTPAALVLCACGLLLLAVPGHLRADSTREEIIAHYASLYGEANAERLYEEMLIRGTVEGFARRVNFRDIISLTGELEEDAARRARALAHKEGSASRNGISVGSSAPKADELSHPGSPQCREFVTTAAQDYTAEQRRTLRSGLLETFLKIPPHVRIDSRTERISLNATTATVDLTYTFRGLEIDTPGSLRLTSLPPASLPLQLRKYGDRWLVEGLQDVARQMAAVVASR